MMMIPRHDNSAGGSELGPQGYRLGGANKHTAGGNDMKGQNLSLPSRWRSNAYLIVSISRSIIVWGNHATSFI